MELLKQRILKDGTEIGTEVVKVDSFLNHQLDIGLFMALGKEIHRRFGHLGINKILTIEASGIGIAAITAIYFDLVPVVFAKKAQPKMCIRDRAFLATAVASSPCPQASWKMTPPKPLSMTTGIFPAGQGFAPSMVMAILAASLAVSSTLIWSKSSKPTEPPGPRCPLCFSVAEDATASTVKRLRTRLSSAQTPSELATNTFLVTSRKPVRVWVMAGS